MKEKEYTLEDLLPLLEEIGVSKIQYVNPKLAPYYVLTGQKKIVKFANLLAKKVLEDVQ